MSPPCGRDNTMGRGTLSFTTRKEYSQEDISNLINIYDEECNLKEYM